MGGPYSGPGHVKVRGQTVLDAQDLNWKYDPNAKPVLTLLGGYSGHTVGAGIVEVSVDNAAPADPAVTLDWASVSARQEEIQLDFVFQGVTHICRGFLGAVEKASGVEKANSVKWSFTGKWLNPNLSA